MKLSATIAKGAFTTSNTKVSGRENKGDKAEKNNTQKPSVKSTLESKLTEVEPPDPIVVSSRVKRTQSSDYGDDDFDDLPSPSVLLNGDVSIETGDTNKDEKKTREDAEIDKNVFDWDDWIEIDDPVEPLTPRQNETNALQQVDLTIQSPSTIAPTEEEMVPDSRALCSFHDVEDYQPSKRTAPFVDENRHPLKRTKTKIQRESFPLSHGQGGLILVERNGANPDPGTNKPSTPSKDWEDIDPLLLDEFKDIVNFF